ncbi:glycosyltransferase family 2 protein [Gramella jeungdoensis]|uniref:Glycosyltransferase family 2 protein n=1 Tax=Gramella jeungdoensis TaxID=708091 RepID=A0ABT0Z432_9FLAO|nr:glycosyltransferase family 2 protein [Gramella jeungdoensis]MCM8570488.1 glycosyltransferase family 2 protein [Gramella jeungdoensis]
MDLLKKELPSVKRFQVSVIIPVYKADKFLKEAVISAIDLKEVGEVILIEDGSPDDSFHVCEELSKKYEKVKLFQHPDGKNKGAGASRNLGVRKASCEYIAFLDADDWYLPNRFVKDVEIFIKYKNVDAAYSSSILEEDVGNNEKRYGAKEDIRRIWNYEITSFEFYKEVLGRELVLFNTNSVTFRKEFLSVQKLFDKRLRLHQDTELWYRLIRRGNFYASEVFKPVAVVRRHDQNRITSRTTKSTLKMFAYFIENVGMKNLYDFERSYLLKKIIRLESEKFDSSLRRRIFYYFTYTINKPFSESYLKQFIKKFNDD